jgi:hypothetical protein
LIGYDTRNEATIQKIVDLIPSKIIFDHNFSKDEVVEYFTTRQVIREIQLSSLLDQSKSINIVLNFNNLQTEATRFAGDRSKDMRDLVRFLNSKLYQISQEGRNVKLILLTSIYKSFSGDPNGEHMQMMGGTGPLYASDYCITLKEDKLKVVKDRIDHDTHEINISDLEFE